LKKKKDESPEFEQKAKKSKPKHGDTSSTFSSSDDKSGGKLGARSKKYKSGKDNADITGSINVDSKTDIKIVSDPKITKVSIQKAKSTKKGKDELSTEKIDELEVKLSSKKVSAKDDKTRMKYSSDGSAEDIGSKVDKKDTKKTYSDDDDSVELVEPQKPTKDTKKNFSDDDSVEDIKPAPKVNKKDDKKDTKKKI